MHSITSMGLLTCHRQDEITPFVNLSYLVRINHRRGVRLFHYSWTFKFLPGNERCPLVKWRLNELLVFVEVGLSLSFGGCGGTSFKFAKIGCRSWLLSKNSPEGYEFHRAVWSTVLINALVDIVESSHYFLDYFLRYFTPSFWEGNLELI